MSKPYSRMLMPALWVGAISLLSIALITAGSSHVHTALAAQPQTDAQAPALSPEQRDRVHAALDALPLAFEANQGQTDPQVKFTARGNGYTTYLTANDTRFVVMSPAQSDSRPEHPFRWVSTRNSIEEKRQVAAIDMRLAGGNLAPQIVGETQLPGTVNYYTGSDQSNWHQGVRRYAEVSYRDVYPGVNMAFRGEQRQLEFDFIVAPHFNPAVIGMTFKGARKLATDGSGNLVLSSTAGDVVLHKPVAYQEKNGGRELVDVAFQFRNENEVAFKLGAYDQDRELVIDPSLTYATYVGGSAEDEAYGIAVDGSGNIYITGQTDSPSFNKTPTSSTNFSVFVTKLNAAGTTFAYTAILGGSGNCSGDAIAVDGSGNAYVAGSATSGFPVLAAFQSAFGGGKTDGFVLKVNPSGVAVYSTYLGGGAADNVNGIAVDGSGNAYVTGETLSSDFPLSASPIQGSNKSGDTSFITELNAAGTSLVYSTYLGGSSGDLGTGISLDSSNNTYVTGITDSTDFPTTSGVLQTTNGGEDDSFVAEIKSGGSALVYSTYLGGSGNDDALGIAVDAAGEAYVTGETTSTNFPTANAAQKALGGSSATNVFVSKLNAGATELLFSTYYGGNQDDAGTGIALDSFADAFVTGRTTSSNYPTGGSAFQTALNGTSDAFITEFANTGFVEYSSFLGGSGTENDALSGSDTQGPIGAVAVDSSGNVYLAGSTASTTDFPVTSGAVQAAYGGGLADAFIAKVGPAPADFSVSVSPTNISTSTGGTTSAITVTVSSVNSAYGQGVALTCAGLPTGASCSFSTSPVTPGATAVTSNLTISTASSSSANIVPAAKRGMPMVTALAFPFLGIALLGVSNPRRRKLFGIVTIGLILMALMMLPACGSSSGGGGGGGGGGTYSITVSGTAGSTTHSAPLILTVNAS